MRVDLRLSLRRMAICAAIASVCIAPVQSQGDVSRAELEALETEREDMLKQLAALEQAGSAFAGDLETL